MRAKIIASGSCVPQRIVSNDELSGRMDTNDEWIRSRTGIRTRRISEECPEKKLFSLALGAAEQAIKMAEDGREQNGFCRSEIELVIVATCTGDTLFPAAACRLQEALGLSAAAFDISLACTGFIAALGTAQAFIESGRYRTVLIVGADVMSRMIDWEDRSTAVLFGDGAGAVILSRCGDGEEASSGVLQTVLHADGSGENALWCGASYLNEADGQMLRMDGRRVFEFAVRNVPKVIREVCEALPAGETVSKYVLHQANFRIIEACAKRLSEPIEKFPHNIEAYGNTTAATIPILLDELNREGKLQRGELLCLAGFGAGLSFGAALLRW